MNEQDVFQDESEAWERRTKTTPYLNTLLTVAGMAAASSPLSRMRGLGFGRFRFPKPPPQKNPDTEESKIALAAAEAKRERKRLKRVKQTEKK